MLFDWTVGVPTLILLVSAICGGIYAWVTVVTRIAALEKSQETQGMSNASYIMADRMMQDRVDSISTRYAQELAEFKLDVAKSYATNAGIREVEERIVIAIDRLGDRLDKIIDGQSKAVIRARRGAAS